MSGFPFTGLVFRDVTRVLDDRVEAVLLFTASGMVSAKRYKIQSTLCKGSTKVNLSRHITSVLNIRAQILS